MSLAGGLAHRRPPRRRKRGLYNLHAAGGVVVAAVAMTSYNLPHVVDALARVIYAARGLVGARAVNAIHTVLEGSALLAAASENTGLGTLAVWAATPAF